MLKKNLLLVCLVILFKGGMTFAQTRIRFKAEKPGKSVTIATLTTWPTKKTVLKKRLDGLEYAIELDPQPDYLRYEMRARSQERDSLFLAVELAYESGTAMNFDGAVSHEEIYRQSVHDPANYFFKSMPRQAIPMMALHSGDQWTIAVSDAPAFSNNYTTQHFRPEQRRMQIASGDTGEKPGKPITDQVIIRPFYHSVGGSKEHAFSGILLNRPAGDLATMRQHVFKAIAKRWGNIHSRFGATAFATNYMLYRTNETGFSPYWVVAGIEYCNKQYSRDAFWQSMVLPPAMEQQSYLHEARTQSTGAERQLFILTWAYRLKKKGGRPDLKAARQSLDYIEKRVTNARYLANSNDDPQKRKNFKSWFDLCMFNDDDVITYNQGLLAVALHAAEELGLQPKTDWRQAAKAYQALYNADGGYFPLSEQKNTLVAVDALVGDLLHQLLFGGPLLEKRQVQAHFQKVSTVARTPHGFKIVCLPDGRYAPNEAFDIPGFESPHREVPVGKYANGGSYYLYDMLFLLAAYVHEIPGAADLLVWRGKMDFERAGTYFEHLNTATGVPGKVNQGWNGAIYAIAHQLEEQGRGKDILTEAIEKLQQP
ncbi:hypothetical protein [Larkinella harenae]